MKPLFLIFFIFICCKLTFATSVNNIIQLKYLNGKNAKIILYGFYGLKKIALDSSVISNKGEIKFLNKNYKTGFYRLQIKDDYLDFIFNEKEETQLKLDGEKLLDEITVLNGTDEKGLIELLKHKLRVRLQISIILKKDSILTNESKVELSRQLNEDQLETERILNKYKGSFFYETAILAVPEQIIASQFEKYKNDTIRYFNEHFFDEVNFSNEALSRTTILPNLYMRYLSRYVEYDESGFKKAIDDILSRAKINQLNYNLTLEYLLDLFQQAGPEIILEYILETYYLENSCNNVDISNELENKIQSYKGLSPGQQAPEFNNCFNSKNDSVLLSQLLKQNKAQSYLLFFWSSHCSFCSQLIETITKSTNANNIKLVGINMDADKNMWLNSPLNKIPNIINLYAPGEWESAIVRRYLVNKTPTIYLINSYGRIEKRNVSLEDVYLVLNPKN